MESVACETDEPDHERDADQQAEGPSRASLLSIAAREGAGDLAVRADHSHRCPRGGLGLRREHVSAQARQPVVRLASLDPAGAHATRAYAGVMNRGGWSWKRQLGITNAKRRVSRATGIPWTKSGRQRKVGAVFWKMFK